MGLRRPTDFGEPGAYGVLGMDCNLSEYLDENILACD